MMFKCISGDMDTIKEVFIDMNMSVLLDMYEDILDKHSDKGFLNNSSSYDFINMVMDHVDINEKNGEYSSDDEY